jgi:palmitoyltransferase
LLLIPLLVCYGRLIQNIVSNPGYTPRGAAWHARKAEENTKGKEGKRRGHKSRRSQSASEKGIGSRSSAESLAADVPAPETDDYGHPRIEDFWHKDVFVCNFDGRPPFCSTCLNWKSDRTHHCSEVNRCVRKMDHFCPWVGGIVSETSYKFFIQFLFYTACFCTHTLIFTAVFFAERARKTHFLDVHWILLLAFAALFWFFSVGMCMSSMQFAMLNVTTIEDFGRRQKVWYLCVYLPRPEETFTRLEAAGRPVPMYIDYPRPAHENLMMLQNAIGEDGSTSATPQAVNSQPSQQTRTFGIIELPAGSNPWDLGRLNNAREILGNSLVDWLLPLKYSPCASHNDPESMFKLGPAVDGAMRRAGLIEEPDAKPRRKNRKRRRSEAADEEDGTSKKSHKHRSRRKSTSRDTAVR